MNQAVENGMHVIYRQRERGNHLYIILKANKYNIALVYRCIYMSKMYRNNSKQIQCGSSE